MRHLNRTLLAGMLGLVVLAAAAWRTATPVQEQDKPVDRKAAVIDGLDQTLTLTEGEKTALQQAFDANEGVADEPGYLWRVAADLQQALNAEQKERLFALLDQQQPGMRAWGQGARRFGGARGTMRRGGRRMGRGVMPHRPGTGGGRQGMPMRPGTPMRRGMRAPGGMRGRGAMQPAGPLGPLGNLDRLATALDLTDTQQEALKGVREKYAPQLREAAEQRRDGTLAPDAFRTRIEEIHEAAKAEVDGILNDEQKAKLDEHRERFGGPFGASADQRWDNAVKTHQVMVEVLNLTDEQQASLKNLREQHRAAMDELRQSIWSGDVDRQAFRDKMQEMREQQRADVTGVFTQTQTEIMKIHRVLATRLTPQRHMAGPRGRR